MRGFHLVLLERHYPLQIQDKGQTKGHNDSLFLEISLK